MDQNNGHHHPFGIIFHGRRIQDPQEEEEYVLWGLNRISFFHLSYAEIKHCTGRGIKNNPLASAVCSDGFHWYCGIIQFLSSCTSQPERVMAAWHSLRRSMTALHCTCNGYVQSNVIRSRYKESNTIILTRKIHSYLQRYNMHIRCRSKYKLSLLSIHVRLSVWDA